MRKLATAAALTIALVINLAGCRSSDDVPRPTTAASSSQSNDVSEHESGPESPIVFGLKVPKGATQLGPLIRSRSEKLIEAYKPALNAALAKKAADEARKAAKDSQDGKTAPTPSPTPEARPGNDTFKLLDDPPKPDTTTSLMRIDGKPSKVAHSMIGQIAALLPKANIDTRNLSTYCTVKEDRYTGCDLAVEGETSNDRQLSVTMTIDPGNVKTRTSPPGAQTRPVVTLTVAYVGDPREGQKDRDADSSLDTSQVPKSLKSSKVIWPKMDSDAPVAGKLLGGSWTVPADVTVLLSGFNPQFVDLATPTAKEADTIAQKYAKSVSAGEDVRKDVVEDLNEVSTTYRSDRKDDRRQYATFVVSARGNYVMLFNLPPLKG